MSAVVDVPVRADDRLLRGRDRSTVD